MSRNLKFSDIIFQAVLNTDMKIKAILKSAGYRIGVLIYNLRIIYNCKTEYDKKLIYSIVDSGDKSLLYQ